MIGTPDEPDFSGLEGGERSSAVDHVRAVVAAAREVTCPKCQAGPNSPCTPHGPHHERVEWAKKFTRKLWG